MKLHLGCGRRFIAGFVHIDIGDFPHLDYRAPIDSLPMIGDEQAELIYCSHAFEYFDRQHALEVLREWRRALKTGGVLRLAVPDFEALARVYQESRDLSQILGPLYGRIEVQTARGPEVLYHRTVYDFRSLEKLCRDAGFRSVAKYDWRSTHHRDVDDFSQAYIPHMDKENGLLISLNVEAVK
jgi:predicted SAM-dependent methyltransferase